jgi:Protein of unknown function (DUF3570)
MRIRNLIITTFLLACLAPQAGADSVNAIGRFMADDESSYVATGAVKYDNEVTDEISLGAKALVDAISGASVQTDHQDPDLAWVGGYTGTSAVGFGEQSPNWDTARLELTGYGGVKIADSQGKLGFIYSYEDTYTSRTLFATFDQEMFLRNSVLSVAYFHNFDEVRTEDEFIDREYGYPKPKGVDGGSVSWTQVLSRKTIARIGISGQFEKGALENPDRDMILVDSAGNRSVLREDLPESRNRYAAAGRLARYLWPGSSVHVGYRYYLDDWDLRAHTGDLEWYQYLSHWLLLRLRGRYYTQGESKHTTFEITENDEFFSANPNLQDFDAYLAGIRLTLLSNGRPKRSFDFSGGLSLDYYTQAAREGVEDGYAAMLAGGNLMFLF